MDSNSLAKKRSSNVTYETDFKIQKYEKKVGQLRRKATVCKLALRWLKLQSIHKKMNYRQKIKESRDNDEDRRKEGELSSSKKNTKK